MFKHSIINKFFKYFVKHWKKRNQFVVITLALWFKQD